METTRHFVATVYVVNEGETLLHEHERLDMWLPPGGHIDRDELPHRTAIREVKEETGLAVQLLQDAHGPRSPTSRPIPQPATILLEDINVHDDGVGHQHIDFIYFGVTDNRDIEPAPGETSAAAWEWVSKDALQDEDRFEPDVVALGREAIAEAASVTASG